MKKVICLIALVMVMPFLTGCYVAPAPGPYYGGGYWVAGHYDPYGHWVDGHYSNAAWVPGHYGPYGGWIPGHWA